MEIKLPNIDSDDYIDVCKLQSNIILNEVSKLDLKKYNYLIVPMRVYNILQFCVDFIGVEYDPGILVHVGYINDLHVYLDMHMPSDEILISYDKSVARDNRLNSLLSNEDIIKEKRVKIT